MFRSAAVAALVALAATAVDGGAFARGTESASIENLRDLSIEELGNIEITSVSKRAEPLREAASSVYVITHDQIRRSGVTSVPEALRLAPNLEVVRVDSRRYAISARGFNTYESSNKLLVLIDGRSVYTALHGGVFWDQQDLMLDDIDRIEVIDGPGGTLWGANAVNGVINIITRKAQDTQGGLANLQYGNQDKKGAVRYGAPLGDNGHVRVYGEGFARGDTVTYSGAEQQDAWDQGQTGFRSDFTKERDNYTLQGDLFRNVSQDDRTDIAVRGYNVLGRWNRDLGNDASVQLQAFFDSVDRFSPGAQDKSETYDLEFQNSFHPAEAHTIVWGVGHRVNVEDFEVTVAPFHLDRSAGTVQVANVFGQDKIALLDNLDLTLGTKVEYNTYTDFEFLPDARLSWQVTQDQTLWSAVSRSVRTPSRIDREFTGGVLKASDFKSEKMTAYELGYRGTLSKDFSLSTTLYRDVYHDLRVLANTGGTPALTFSNGMHGAIYGVESWANIQLLPWWRLRPGVNLMEKRLERNPGTSSVALDQHQGNDPETQLSLRSQMDLPHDLELDAGVRFYDSQRLPDIEGYWEADARLGWNLTPALDVSLTGYNMLNDHHPESGSFPGRSEIRRGVIAGVRWKF